MHRLPASTVKLLSSTQVITSTSSAVKELLENSLDAGATSVEVKLEGYGLDKIEVRDNGCGVNKENAMYMAQPHYTSKLSTTEDLECLSTYGFRGEALGSLCAVADVSVITKSANDDISTEYSLDHKGCIIKTKPSHLGQGTTVIVSQIFKNLPVRKQFHNNEKRKKDTLKIIEDLLMAFGIVCPHVRISLKHNKNVLWQKNPTSNTRTVLHSTFGSVVMSQLQYLERSFCDPQCTIEAYLPSNTSKPVDTNRNNAERTFIAVNSRPVKLQFVEKLLKQYYSDYHKLESAKYPVGFLHIRIPSKHVDVNVDPNKSQVMLHDKDGISQKLEEILQELYSPVENVPPKDVTSNNVKLGSKPTTATNKITDSVNQCVENVTKNPNDTILKQSNVGNSKQNKDDCVWVEAHKIENRLGECDIDTVRLSSTIPEYNNANLDGSCELHISSTTDKSSEQCGTGERSTFEINKVNDPISKENETETAVNAVEKNNNIGDAGIRTESETVLGSAIGEGAEAPDFSVMDELDDVLLMDIDLSVKNVTEGTAKEWSKGTSIKDKTGSSVQPVSLLVPCAGKLSEPPTVLKPELNRKTPLLSNMIQSKETFTEWNKQATLYDMLCSTTSPNAVYVYFSKEIRPQVLADHPKATLQEVTQIVGDKWNSLDEDKRKQYEERMNADIQRYKNKQVNCPEIPTKKRKLSKSPKSQVKLSTDARSCSSVTSHTPKSVTVTFSWTKLKNITTFNWDHCRKGKKNGNNLSVIGTIQSSLLWIMQQGSKLQVFQPSRAKELLLYEKLLSDHALPMVHLETPIKLTKSMFQETCWDTLLCMKKKSGELSDCYIHCTDERLVKNGFHIKQYQDCNEELEITSLTNCMNFYGVQDLMDILKHISLTTNKDQCSLRECRTTKIQHYLQGEAVRMSRKLPTRFTKKECMELLDYLCDYSSTSNLSNMTTCFHGKPMIGDLYDLDNIPASQNTFLDTQ